MNHMIERGRRGQRKTEQLHPSSESPRIERRISGIDLLNLRQIAFHARRGELAGGSEFSAWRLVKRVVAAGDRQSGRGEPRGNRNENGKQRQENDRARRFSGSHAVKSTASPRPDQFSRPIRTNARFRGRGNRACDRGVGEVRCGPWAKWRPRAIPTSPSRRALPTK